MRYKVAAASPLGTLRMIEETVREVANHFSCSSRTESPRPAETRIVRLVTVFEANDKLCGPIYNLTDDVHIKSVVNSVFDTTSVEETLAEFKSINGGERPDVIELKKRFTL